MKRQYQMVKRFHEAFGVEMPNEPVALTSGGTTEEFGVRLDEMVQAMKTNSACGFGGQVLQRASWIGEELAEFMKADTIEDQADALTDILYFTIGTFTLMGINPEPLFTIVNNANMAKLWPDGEPRYNDQGKIVKPDGWIAPEPLLRNEIHAQRQDAKLNEHKR